MLKEGDIWLSERTDRHHSTYIFRIRAWRKGAWRDWGGVWSLANLIDQNTNKGLQKIENRPKLATYTGVYRYNLEKEKDSGSNPTVSR
jgi:hypothetical protein